MATHTLVPIIKNPVNEAEVLLIKQTPPPKFDDPEYDSFADSDLWDLPSAHLLPLTPTSAAEVAFHVNQCEWDCFDLNKFDLNSAVTQVLGQVGFVASTKVEWRFHKCVEEPDFGPGLPTKIVFIIGILGCRNENLNDRSKWMSIERCRTMLMEAKPNEDRIGQFVTMGLINSSTESGNCKLSQALNFQEYLPGFTLVPMGSRTGKPFRTTNLIVLVPGKNSDGCSDDSFAAHGEALIVDPGCKSALYDELKELISALPRKLVVFVTHHHHDHVDGLSVVQKCNPDASLVAHENTMRRIEKGDWSLGYVSVSGSEEICIGGQRLKIVSAPGHTDGHLALLHVSSNTLIVGDHCVGQGSSVLDITSGGHMGDYFQTTYKFLELSPHALIPMHGRVNMWPKHMLCGYLRNRRKRESTILKAMENGAKTLFDIVAYTYADVDPGFWVLASSNVRLHVDHLAQQDKLPGNFSIHKFKKSCGLHFLLRFLWTYIRSTLPIKLQKVRSAFLYGALVATIACLVVLLSKTKWHG